ncbi:MAG: AraC family transcriptional regulator [Fusicatenibacter sp.]|nr:AraC family transcriptional regulator [Lachnospiraceae bacterium]MDY2936734.1 AraC family transcriptional regulator [Fusicatenibacter sp.]
MADYDSIISFTRKLLKNSNIDTYLADEDALSTLDLDYGLRKKLAANYNQSEAFHEFFKVCQDRILYCFEDQFFCRHFLMKLPDTSPQLYLIGGPYTFYKISDGHFLKLQQSLHLPNEYREYFKQYYSCIPFVEREDFLQAVVFTLASEIYGGTDEFSVCTSDIFHDEINQDYYRNSIIKPDNRELIEHRYQLENQLIQAVSLGSLEDIQPFITGEDPFRLEQRSYSLLRNNKNYLIVLNTLLRKAAESGGVPPLYLDDLSSQYAREIEQMTDHDSYRRLSREMIRKYTLTVKSHSVKGYSPILQKVLTYINMSLTEDLSLRALSLRFSISPTYLSATFKKETKSTLTEYVNRKRVEHSILLLNTTNLRIQTIASSCGIDDINYFTRLFKKYMGQTPSAYRTMIRKH